MAGVNSKTTCSEHQNECFGSSLTYLSSSSFWSERSEKSIRKNDSSLFLEERNGIEIIERPDIEDGTAKKLETPRDFRRRKSSIKFVMIVTALLLLWSLVHVVVQQLNRSRNVPTSENLGESQTSNIEDWFNSKDGIGASAGTQEGVSAGTQEDVSSETQEAEVSDDYNSSLNSKQQDTLPFQYTPVEPGEIVVLYPNEYLEAGQFRYSPNGRFKVGLTERDGNFVLVETNLFGERVVWSARMDSGSNWVSTLDARCFMQGDGNLVLRDSQTKKSIWMTRTHGNQQARLVLDDSGRVAVISGDGLRTALWMNGVPREHYTGPSSNDMMFPIRGAFYYP